MRAVVLCFAITACAAADSPGLSGTTTTTSGDGGSGGDGGEGGSAAGGEVGGGGSSMGDEPMEAGVAKATSLGYEASELACARDTLYWFDRESRRVMRLVGADHEEALAIDGDGDVLVRPAGDAVLVSRLSERGAVWLVSGSTATPVHDGPVLYAASGSVPYWYDGQDIRNNDGVVATPDAPVETFAMYDDAPVFITDADEMYIVGSDGATFIGDVPTDYYKRTFTVAGSTAAFGSRGGLRIMRLSDGKTFSFGSDVVSLGHTGSGLYVCESTADGARIRHMDTQGRFTTIANHASCVSIVDCGGNVYWATTDGDIMRAPASQAE